MRKMLCMCSISTFTAILIPVAFTQLNVYSHRRHTEQCASYWCVLLCVILIKRMVWEGGLRAKQRWTGEVKEYSCLQIVHGNFLIFWKKQPCWHVIVQFCCLWDGTQPVGTLLKNTGQCLSSWGKKAVMAYFPRNILPWMPHGWHC